MVKPAGYPNREHEKAEIAARRRAVKALSDLAGEAALLAKKLEDGVARVDGDDTQQLASLLRDAIQQASVLGAFAEAREWHAADEAQAITRLLAGDRTRMRVLGEVLGTYPDLSLPPGERDEDQALRVIKAISAR